MSQPRTIAVLTGEVQSTFAPDPELLSQALDVLQKKAVSLEAWTDAPLMFTRQRGAGWQVALHRPELALRAALAFRTVLRAADARFDSYIGVASGQIATPLGADLNAETSDAFVGSGAALDYVKGDQARRLACHGDVTLEAITTLADHISARWSQAQAAAALPFLTPGPLPSYTAVAKDLGKSRQAVTKAVDAAHVAPLTYALMCLEEARRHP